MKHLKFFLLFFVIVSVFSSNIEGALASTYPSSVAWNNLLYGLSPRKSITKILAMRLERLNAKELRCQRRTASQMIVYQ